MDETYKDKLTFKQGLEATRVKLLNSIKGKTDLYLIVGPGNRGDLLIQAGMKQLLSGQNYKMVERSQYKDISGDTAIIIGSGDWITSQGWAKYLAEIEKRFNKTIIFPSTYKTSVPSVQNALKQSKALFFAREEDSYNSIKNLCHADLAYDCAFFFDFEPYQQRGKGILTAFRKDEGFQGVDFHRTLSGNKDISQTCSNLDEWLSEISKHDIVRTDRAHVMIAAAMLRKRVMYRPYEVVSHKVPGIAEYSLQDFPVYSEV